MKGKKQPKKPEYTQNQNPSAMEQALMEKDTSATEQALMEKDSSVTEQALMEKDCVPLSEVGFKRWMIRSFWELKELVLTQCKETKNWEKRLDEMLTIIDNIERNINELTELKNTTRELSEICTSLNSRMDQAEERISEVEDLLNEIKHEDKIREKE